MACLASGLQSIYVNGAMCSIATARQRCAKSSDYGSGDSMVLVWFEAARRHSVARHSTAHTAQFGGTAEEASHRGQGVMVQSTRAHTCQCMAVVHAFK